MKRDIRSEFDQVIKQMEWGEIIDTLQAAVEDVLGATPDTSPFTSLPPGLPTELGYNIYPQPVYDVHEAHQQAGFHSQGQHTLFQTPVYNHPGPSPSIYYPAAPAHSTNKVPATSWCESQNLVPLQLLNEELVYRYTVHHPDYAAPPAPTSMLKKRKYNKPQGGDQPYVKKPLNAFMLFMKEERQKVVAEINNRNNATVNRVLGQRWAALSDQERHRFYQKAETEKLLHASQNPGWSSSDNYGKKRKRQRGKVQTAAESSASKPGDIKQQTEQTAVMEAETSQRAMMMPYSQDMDFLTFSDSLSFLDLLQLP